MNDKKVIVIKSNKDLYDVLTKRIDELEERLTKLEKYCKFLYDVDLSDLEII